MCDTCCPYSFTSFQGDLFWLSLLLPRHSSLIIFSHVSEGVNSNNHIFCRLPAANINTPSYILIFSISHVFFHSHSFDNLVLLLLLLLFGKWLERTQTCALLAGSRSRILLSGKKTSCPCYISPTRGFVRSRSRNFCCISSTMKEQSSMSDLNSSGTTCGATSGGIIQGDLLPTTLHQSLSMSTPTAVC